MFVTELTVTDFRNYASAKVNLGPGVNVFIGANGQGKTNLVEAVEYLSTMSSHRVSASAPLIRADCDSALLGAKVRAGIDDERQLSVELELSRSRATQARLNRNQVSRPRDIVGALRTVVFSPMDLAIVRGDPADRRAWLDSLVVTRWPRMAGVKQDYDRVLKQRNALLKSMSGRRLGPSGTDEEYTLEVWNESLARIGAELLHARLDTLADLQPLAQQAYEIIAPVNNLVSARYRASVELGDSHRAADVRGALQQRLLTALADNREAELARGITLVGPHRDEIELRIGDLPAKGYASHGESWSLALALRLGGFELVRADGTEPVLVLDDVFAELDTTRRERLAQLASQAEQVLITAAVETDVPKFATQRRFRVNQATVIEAEEVAEAGSAATLSAAAEQSQTEEVSEAVDE